MAKNQKIADSSLKPANCPLSQTVVIHSSVSKLLGDEHPELKAPLADTLKYTDIKAQRQAFKNILASIPTISSKSSLHSLAKFALTYYLDSCFAPLRNTLLATINALLPACTSFLSSPEERSALAFCSDVPSSCVEYRFVHYMEVVAYCGVEISRGEVSSILAFVVERIEALRAQSAGEGSYSVMITLSLCLRFSSSLLSKSFPEALESDVDVLKVLADGALELSRRQFVDRDILNLAGANYWLATVPLLKRQAGDCSAATELNYLNAAIAEKVCQGDVKKGIAKTPNTLCIIKGFLKVATSVDCFYEPCIIGGSYFDFMLQCCESDQLNTKIYALLTLHSLLEKETEATESPRGKVWAQQILEVVLKNLDSPHKGTGKAADDCLKVLLQVTTKRSLKTSDVVLPLVDSIPPFLRKRKLSALTTMVEYLSAEELKRVEGNVKYALESVLKDPAVTRLASACIDGILTRLKKNCKSTEEWLANWCEEFIFTLASSRDKIMVHLNSMVDIILNIDHGALPVLVVQVLGMLEKEFKTEVLIVLLALLIEARRLKKLKYRDESLVVADKVEVKITEELLTALFNLSNGYVTLLLLNLCTSDTKLTSLPEPLSRLIFVKAISAPTTNTYDDYREKFTKLCRKYLADLKLRYDHIASKQLSTSLSVLQEHIAQISSIATARLRIDSGYDILYQPLSILRSLWESFGEVAVELKLHSRPLALLAVHGLFSTWEMQRGNSYALLERCPVEVLSKEEWKEFGKSALRGLCSPRSTEAEGAALYLKLVCEKLGSLEEVEWDAKSREYATTLPQEEQLPRQQLRWAKIILQRVKAKRRTLSETLFKKASCEDLFHGELRLLHLIIQSTKLEQSEAAGKEWKELINDLLEFLQEVSDYCEGLLSFAGASDEETGNIAVDCRGRLSQKSEAVKREIADAAKTVEREWYFGSDYENLLSTGTWLLAKESGNLYKRLAEWLVFPGFNQPSWLTPEEVESTALNLLGKILSYKHRGAFLKSVEVLQTVLSKCFRSGAKQLQTVPERVLAKALEYVEGTSEGNQSLRRSAGIPHSILAVLRAEIQPVLLTRTIDWLLEKTNSEVCEVRVHCLNILRFVFEDSEIRQDVASFVYKVLMAATKGFLDSQWKVRNGSLMLFTAATKRIFGSSSTVESHLNKQRKSIYEFFGHSESLCKFMLQMLQQNGPRNDSHSKFAVFPILLLFSRLAPSPYTKSKMYIAKHVPLFRLEIMKLLGHPDIGIRKMAAKALLPLTDSMSHLKEAVTCITAIKLSGNDKARLKINLTHGLLEFVHQLLKAHFKNPAPECSYDSLLKSLEGIAFLANWNQSLVQATLYKALNKLVNKKSPKYVFEKFQELALKTCMADALVNTMQGFANSIRQQLAFITRFDAAYNTSSVLALLEKNVSRKDWENVAWIYRELSAINGVSISTVPCIDHIYTFNKASEDAMKQCLKLTIRQATSTSDLETLKQFWSIAQYIQTNCRKSSQIEKQLLILICRLVRQSLNHKIDKWLTCSTKPLIKQTLHTIYEAQYYESKYSIRLTTAIEFANLATLLLPETVLKGEDMVELHSMAVRIAVLLLNSDNAEVRGYTARTISEHLQISARLKGKVWGFNDVDVEIAHAGFNEECAMKLLFDRIEREMVSGSKSWVKEHVAILWEMVTNRYFLENLDRNEGKNLVFAHEQSNEYLNNVELKLFALERLCKIPNAKDYLSITQQNTITPESAVSNLYRIKHQISISTKQNYIQFVEDLIVLYIKEHVMGEKMNAAATFKALEASGIASHIPFNSFK